MKIGMFFPPEAFTLGVPRLIEVDRSSEAPFRKRDIDEDVEKILPNLIGYDENGKPIGIHYTKLTAYLIEAVKELTGKIKRLENK